MNRIDNSGQGMAQLGRDEDQYMAHVAQGEMVVPPVITPETRRRIEQELRAAGLSPDEYKVGDGMSINPITGMPEFGFLKKVFKKIKKVVKKIAPIAVNFIPGVGPLAKAALTAGVGKASGMSTKQALLSGLGSFAGNKLFGGSGVGGKAASKGNFFSRAKEFIMPGNDGIGIFGNVKEYVMPGEDGVGLFGNLTGGGQGTEYEIQPGDNLTKIAQESGVTVEELMKANGITDPNMIQAGAKLKIPGSSGGFKDLFGGEGQGTGLEAVGDGTYMDPVTKEIYTTSQLSEMGLLDASGNLKGSALSKLSGISEGGFNIKDLFGGGTPGQSRLGLIEDMLKGKSSDPVRDGGGLGGFLGGGGSGGGMGNLGIAGISALLGKMAYDSAKDRMGGLAATPAVTMDSLGRYSLSKALGTGGTREEFGLPAAQESLKFNMGGPVQYFSQGGAAIKELDMRDGGESAGPGTGTSDDIPAMLSDGEFVMTAKATRGAGAFGMNKTKSGIELIKGGKASREKGVKNMRELMNIFEAI